MTIGSQITIPTTNAHMSLIEAQIVSKLIADLLGAGMSITVWNVGDEPELADSKDAVEVFKTLAASDSDELTVEDAKGYAGWIRLVWGNDCSVISDYSVRLEPQVAAANKLADKLENGTDETDPENIYGLASIRQSIEEERK